MIKVIWKYELEIQSLIKIKMPIGAEILTVQTQNEKPCLWALVDPKQDLIEREFQMIGTGHTLFTLADRKYIGTYQLLDELLVFHLFEYFK